MKAAFYIDTFKVQAQETADPQLKDGDVLLKVEACGVCGTDIRKVREGLAKPPLVLGHEVAGEVVEIGKDVTKFSLGDRMVVAHHTPCWVCHYCRHENFSMCAKFKRSNLDPGGFAELVRVPADHVEMTAFKIPDHVTYEQAIYMEPLACVLRNLKRCKLLPGDTALIVGLGSMGLLTGQALLSQALKVIGSDLKEDRMNLAKTLGFQHVLNASDSTFADKIRKYSEDRGADVVILTAGNASVYSQSTNWVRNGGKINIFAGLPKGQKLEFESHELYSREITVFSSYSPSPVELFEALECISARKINVDILKAKNYSLENLGEAIDDVVKQEVFKAIIRPQADFTGGRV